MGKDHQCKGLYFVVLGMIIVVDLELKRKVGSVRKGGQFGVEAISGGTAEFDYVSQDISLCLFLDVEELRAALGPDEFRKFSGLASVGLSVRDLRKVFAGNLKLMHSKKNNRHTDSIEVEGFGEGKKNKKAKSDFFKDFFEGFPSKNTPRALISERVDSEVHPSLPNEPESELDILLKVQNTAIINNMTLELFLGENNIPNDIFEKEEDLVN